MATWLIGYHVMQAIEHAIKREQRQSTTVVPWLSYSPLDARFAGSILAGVDGFFQSVKILSMTSFGREVKLWHIKEPQAEIRASEQNLSDFSRSL